MSTHKRKINYRKIYKNAFGEIPKDANGRSFEIHHKDGDFNNNDPSNLIALTIQEHYDLHYQQKDYGAALLIGLRMKKSSTELSELISRSNKKRIEAGTHPSQIEKNISDNRNRQNDKVKAGTHPWQSQKYKDAAKNRIIKLNSEKLLMGSHNFQLPDAKDKVRNRNITNSNRPIIQEIKELSKQCKIKFGYTLAKSGWNGKSDENLKILKNDLINLLYCR